MPENILTPISNVILKENDNLALIFPKNISRNPSFEVFFFRVMRRYPLQGIYTQLDELSPDEKLDFNFLGDKGFGDGDDISEVWRERPYRILHFAIGVKPCDMWLYKAMPSDIPQTGFGHEKPPKVGDEQDFIPSELSPFDSPTVATESVMYYMSSMMVGLKNNSPHPVKPILRLMGAGYDVIPITDREFINKMIAGVKPVRYITFGGLRSFTYTIPEEWQGNGFVLNKQVIEEVMTKRK